MANISRPPGAPTCASTVSDEIRRRSEHAADLGAPEREHFEATSRSQRVSTAPPTVDRADLERALRDKQELLLRERASRRLLERSCRALNRLMRAFLEDVRGPLNASLDWTALLQRESTAGEIFHNRIHDDSIVAAIARFDSVTSQVASAPLDGNGSQAAGELLARTLWRPDRALSRTR